MSPMLLSPRNRANTKHATDIGGRHCACCDHPPKHNKRVRRSMRRIERNLLKGDLRWL